MVWPAVIGAIGSIAGGWLASRGQKDANRTNIALQRDQQGWEERMANTEVQRRKADLESAGFNPMLSFTSGQAASTPSIAPARVENERSSIGEGVSRAMATAAQAAQLKLLEKQVSVAEAQARKTNAEAAITESDVQFSAQSAQHRAEALATSAAKLAADLEGTRLSNMSASVAFEKLQPIAVEMQRALMEGVRLSNVEKRAVAELYETVKGMKGVERLLPLILSVLRAR